jgi:hypothetical protein
MHFDDNLYQTFYFDADPDPTFHLDKDPDPDQILFRIKVMRICNDCSTRLHFEPLGLHCERPSPSMVPF